MSDAPVLLVLRERFFDLCAVKSRTHVIPHCSISRESPKAMRQERAGQFESRNAPGMLQKQGQGDADLRILFSKPSKNSRVAMAAPK